MKTTGMKWLIVLIFMTAAMNMFGQSDSTYRIGFSFSPGRLISKGEIEPGTNRDVWDRPIYSFGLNLEMPHKRFYFSYHLSLNYGTAELKDSELLYYSGYPHSYSTARGYSFQYTGDFIRLGGLIKLNFSLTEPENRIQLSPWFGMGVETTIYHKAEKNSYHYYHYSWGESYYAPGQSTEWVHYIEPSVNTTCEDGLKMRHNQKTIDLAIGIRMQHRISAGYSIGMEIGNIAYANPYLGTLMGKALRHSYYVGLHFDFLIPALQNKNRKG